MTIMKSKILDQSALLQFSQIFIHNYSFVKFQFIIIPIFIIRHTFIKDQTKMTKKQNHFQYQYQKERQSKQKSKIEKLKPCKESKYQQNVKKYDEIVWLELCNNTGDQSKAIRTQQIKKHIIGYEFTNIQVLSLGRNKIRNDGLKLLMTASWPLLKQLYLYSNEISEINCLDQLNLNQITDLSLDLNQLDLRAVQFLIAGQIQWRNLTFLSIQFQDYQSDECWKQFSENQFKQFAKLRKLWICGSQLLTPETKQKICNWWRTDQVNRKLKWYNSDFTQQLGINDKFKK